MIINLSFFILILSTIASLNFSILYASKWDVEYWQYLNWKNWECSPYKLYTIGEMRLNHDVSKFYYFKISENFAYQVHPRLDLEAHYCYLYSKGRGATNFTNTNRIELELNPSLPLNDGITLNWRNRMTFIKKQSIEHIQYVFRHRFKVVFPITNCSHLVAFSCSDEIYYDMGISKLTQNRFIPAELTFQLLPKLEVDVFLMVRNFFSTSSDKWYRSIVLGSEFHF